MHVLDQVRRRRPDPNVDGVGGGLGLLNVRDEFCGIVNLPAGDVLHQESEGIVPGEEHLLDDTENASLLKLEGLGANNGRVDEVHAQSVGSELINDNGRIRVVLQPFTHLLPVTGQNQPIHNDVLERGLVEKRRTQDHQRVEPAPGLVQPLRDKVSGETVLELLLVLERVVLLGVRHAAALEPAVEDLVDPLEESARVILARNLNVVDALPVEISDLDSREFLQLLDGPDTDDLAAILVSPDGNRSSPKPVPGDRPVARIREPVVKPALLDVVGNPVRFVVVLHQLVLDGCNVDEPAGDRLVD